MAHASSPYAHLTDLLSQSLGGHALACSDDFFASMDNLVVDADPVFDPDAYYERGKVMDGWESRRKRGAGSDWCILKLGAPGVVRAADLDTRHFTGNHAPWASIEACSVSGDPTADQLRDDAEWVEILPAASLVLGSHNPVPVHDDRVFTHVRLNIFPDGGVARLRLYGEVKRELEGTVDLAALENGGKALACSDMYFGVMDHLIAPGRASDMRGGWETRRRRGEGHDWVLIRLARRGHLDRLLIDTNHFKGNFPDTAELEGIDWEGGPPPLLLQSNRWQTILPPCKLTAHEERHIDLDDAGPFTHLRLKIRPCGGISRLRVFGRPAELSDPVVDAWNGLGEAEASDAFLQTCGSKRWADRMSGERPFRHRGALLSAARRLWDTSSRDDLLEAFAHHPRIGENPERLREKYGATAHLASNEQAGVSTATEETLDALANENLAYEQRYGHVFLVCATGKSASEMLAILRTRMQNSPERELREAAEQQAQITFIRLLKGPNGASR